MLSFKAGYQSVMHCDDIGQWFEEDWVATVRR